MKISEMKLRQIFDRKDFLTFGLAWVLSIVAFIAVMVYSTDTEIRIISGLASLIVGFIYWHLVRLRIRVWKRISFFCRGIGFIDDELTVQSPAEFSLLKEEIRFTVNSTLDNWRATARNEVRDPDFLVRDTLVLLKDLPTGNIAGRTFRTKKAATVAVNRRPMTRSSLGHELGHIILMTAGLPYEEPDLLEWYKNYGIPY